MKNKFNKEIKVPRGMNANGAIRDIVQKKNLEILKCNEDSCTRMEIHGIIVARIKEGKSKDDIKNELLGTYKYKKYEMYLDTWINDKIKKNAIKMKRKENSQKEK